ncbi:hypothetical protein [Tessaracoccus sp. Z1128]
MARVVVADGLRRLEIVGGRDGHPQGLRAELLDARQQWEESGSDEFGETITRRLDTELSDPHADMPARSIEIPRDLDRAAHAATMEPFSTAVVCPRCHTPAAVSIVRTAGRWDAVLT